MKFKVVQTYDNKVLFRKEDFDNIDAEYIQRFCETEEEILQAAGDADAIVTHSPRQPFPKRLIEKLSKCRIIASTAVGYDKIDIEAATKKGICVTNVPGLNTQDVSEHTMALLLACAKRIPIMDKVVKSGMYCIATHLESSPISKMLVEEPIVRVAGKILGLIGFGNIARAVVPKARAFGLEIVAYSPSLNKETANMYEVKSVSFDDLLRGSDFISIHAPLNPSTFHLIGKEQFRLMKKTSFLINTSRGALVDEKELLLALKEGWIRGAALDVMEQDPPGDTNPLFGREDVIITPHIAAHSDMPIDPEAFIRPPAEVLRVLRGEWPIGLVNPKVKEVYQRRWGLMTIV